MEGLSSVGGSVQRTQALKDAIARFEDFRNSSAIALQTYKEPWEQQPERVLCRRRLYEQFSKWLVDDYVIPAGRRGGGTGLSPDVAQNTVRNLINQASRRFKATTSDHDTKQFLTCLEPKSSTDDWRWLQGLLHNVSKKVYDRCLEKGEETDKSASALALPAPPPPPV